MTHSYPRVFDAAVQSRVTKYHLNSIFFIQSKEKNRKKPWLKCVYFICLAYYAGATFHLMLCCFPAGESRLLEWAGSLL